MTPPATFPESDNQMVSSVKTIHLREYFYVLKNRKTIVLTVFLLIAAATILFASLQKKYYTTSSQILIEQNWGDGYLGSAPSAYFYRYDPSFLNTQIAIIKSPAVTRKVVNKLQLNTKYRTFFLPPETKQDSRNSSGILQKIKSIISTYIIPVSSSSSSPLQEEPQNISHPPASVDDVDLIASMISNSLEIKPAPKSDIINVSFSHTDPGIAQLIANEIVTAYMDTTLEIKMDSNNRKLEWMTTKAEEEQKRLAKSEAELQNFMRRNDLVTIDDGLAIYPEKITEFTSRLSEVQSQKKNMKIFSNK